MTLDRDQIKRDAEWVAEHAKEREPRLKDLANHCLALLTELTEAERERDELGPLFIRDCCRVLGVDENDYLRMDKIAHRLAKTPALVEALHDPFLAIMESHPEAEQHVNAEMARAAVRLREALAAWEQQ